jgi:hypothetical protein
VSRTIAMLFLLSGCTSPDEVEGEWLGICDFDGDEVEVLVDISSASHGIVDGDIQFNWRRKEWSAELEGTRSEDVVELSFEIEFDGEYAWDGLLEGDLDSNSIEGPMTLDGGEFDLEGDCVLDED